MVMRISGGRDVPAALKNLRAESPGSKQLVGPVKARGRKPENLTGARPIKSRQTPQHREGTCVACFRRALDERVQGNDLLVRLEGRTEPEISIV